MFDGWTVVITGASSGLGRQVALDFAENGANTVLFARSEDRLQEVRNQIEAKSASGESVVVKGDVTSQDDCQHVIETASSRFQNLDCLVTAAGISMWSKFEETDDPSVFETLMETNYLGTVHCIHEALPHLKESGGSFVAVSSIQGKIGVPYHTGYAASKHAVQGFCNSLRLELEDNDVHVMTFLPSWIKGTNLRENAIGTAPGRDEENESSVALPVTTCSEALLNGIRKQKREVALPFKIKLLGMLYNLLPGFSDGIISSRVEQEQQHSDE